jgi:hypothetical protein
MNKRDLEFALDPMTQKIHAAMPAWHGKINRKSLVPLYGQFFTFWGIDPKYPNRIILEWKQSNGKVQK